MKIAEVRLEEVIDFFNGKAPPKSTQGEFPVYGSNGQIGWANEFNHGAGVIIGRVGAYCGSVEVCEGKFWASDNTIVVKPKNDHNLTYLYYRLKSMPLRSYAGGAAQPLLTQGTLKAIMARIADQSSQSTIASTLSSYDNLIENNRRRIALLERAARELYREWFVRLRFPGHEHVKIVDGVPEGWERIHLSRLVSTQYGYTASASDEPIGPKFLRGTDINKQSYIDWAKVPHCPEDGLDFEKYALRPGDLLVIRMADPGKVAIVEREINAIFASYLVRLLVRSDAEIAPLFLFYILTDSEYQGFIRAASGGATRKSASAKLLTDFRALRPPEIIQDVFVDQVSPLRKMIGTLLDQNSKASLCRDLLLPRLMSGELAV